MSKKEWYRLDEIVPSEGIPTWQVLGHINSKAMWYWLSVGRKRGWLKVGKHVKPLFPDRQRSPLLVHLERCQNIGTPKAM